jgi:uncharacterized membrane protein
MHQSHRSNICSTRTVLPLVLGVICTLIIAAPLLASHSFHRAASILYLVFSPICHQIPERSFRMFGNSLAVCHRCSGIYLGMFLGSFLENRAMHRSVQARRLWVLGAILPMLLDGLAPLAGLWTGSSLTRFSTGLLFGTLISSLLVRGLAEFVREAPWRRFTLQNSQLNGGLS